MRRRPRRAQTTAALHAAVSVLQRHPEPVQQDGQAASVQCGNEAASVQCQCRQLESIAHACRGVLGQHGWRVPEEGGGLAPLQRLVACCEHSGACMHRAMRLLHDCLTHEGSKLSDTLPTADALQSLAARVAARMQVQVICGGDAVCDSNAG